MDVNCRNGGKIVIFLELFGPPCRNALADLDGSTPECAQVCAIHTEPHLEALRKIEMVAGLCTNETTPIFWVFNSPSTRPPHVAEISLKMQKFHIDSYSNENFIFPFFRPRAPLTPKGENTHPEPEYARMQNLAWIGLRVVEKSLTKNEQKNKNKTNIQ